MFNGTSTAPTVTYAAVIPGAVLGQGTLPVTNGKFTYAFDPAAIQPDQERVALPGLAALKAAAFPAASSALYFVARGDGSHEFSTNLADHNRSVRRFQLLGRPAARQAASQHPLERGCVGRVF